MTVLTPVTQTPAGSSDHSVLVFPASPTQRRLWIVQQVHGPSAAYTLAAAFRLSGRLDPATLAVALDRLVARHEALRTVILERNGEPVQAVAETGGFVLETRSLDGVPAAEREAVAARQLDAAAREPFDLAVGPLFRALLLRLAEDRHLLMVSLHHAVADGWSIRLLVRDLAELYRRALDLSLPPLPEAELQFGDYAAWAAEAGVDEEGLRWWCRRLEGLTPLPLPVDRPLPAVVPPDGARLAFRVPSADLTALEALAQAEGCTPFMAWAAVHAVALARLCGRTDIAIGMPVANRDRPELAEVVGFFANTVVLRIGLAGVRSFRQALAAARKVILEALAHQSVPFDAVVTALRLPRSSGLQPLFQTMLVYEPAPLDGEGALPALPGLTVTPVELETGAVKVEVGLELVRRADGLDGVLEYSTALFGEDAARRIVDGLLAAVSAALADPDAPLGLAEGDAVAGLPETARPAAAEVVAEEAAEQPPDDALSSGLRDLWRHFLEQPDAGPQTDFFLAGGHSLLAIRMAAAIRDRWPADVAVRDVFTHPTPAAMAAHMRSLLGASDAGPAAVPSAEPPAGEEGQRFQALPLSSAQMRIWLHQKLHPRSPAYNIFGAFTVKGPLDLERLRRALAACTRRHEALRTGIRSVDGQPVQAVVPVALVALPVVDLEYLPALVRPLEVQRLAREEAQRPFDLGFAPLLRAQLLRLAEGDHVLLVTLHHIVGDGWSIDILARDLLASYALGEERLPPLPVRCADHAALRDGLPAERRAGLLDYWRRQLDGLPNLDLPTDRPRPAEPGTDGGMTAFTLDGALFAGIRQFAAETRATAFMVVATAFAILLSRYSGQTDFGLGLPVSGRDRREFEDVVGCFVNTVVLRCALTDGDGEEPGFRALVARMRDTLLDAVEAQDLPFEQVVEALAPPRDLSRNPLFQVMIAHRASAPVDGAAIAGGGAPDIVAEPLAVDTRVAQFDLTLYVHEEAGRMAGTLVFRRDLFDSGTLVRFGRQLVRLLESALAEPERPFGDLDILPGEERARLAAWNDTAFDYGVSPVLTDILDEQFAAEPDATAVIAEEGTLTRGALHRAALRLAGAVRRHGAGPAAPVAVCLPRSLDLVVALVAALKAGAAFLPLDPDLPAERRRAMIEDAGARVLIAAGDPLPDGIPGGVPEGVAVVDPAALPADDGLVPDGETFPGNDAGGDLAAYILFTSGSTGRPKGVVVSNGALVNRLLWMQQAYPLHPGSRVLQKTPLSFDVCVWEFFWPLAVGAQLVMARPGGHRDPGYLAGCIAAHGITHVHFVPSMLDVFLPAADPARCASLRHVFVSGEALTAELERRYFERGLGAGLHNLYGPVEAAIDVTAYDCRPPGGRRTPPIGHAVPNTRIHILDRRGNPCPIRVPGEIVIGGVQVAQGYVGRPDLTAERFLPDPLVPGGRLYRTGDLGRYLEDGSIEFLGRVDFQIKLFGQRIEPGEIEAVLLAQPGVRAAVCILAGGKGTGRPPSLAAYVAAEEGAALQVAALRRALAQRLPAAMVPATITVLPALPLSRNGKIDRAALPEPEPNRPAQHVPPGEGTEARIAAVWRQLLGRAEVGATDNFFEIGGTSLLLVQAHARLEPDFPTLRIIDLFRNPSIATLAAMLDARPGSAHPGSDAGLVAAPNIPVADTGPAAAEDGAVAIIGMAGRFPGAGSVEAFWDNLCAGHEAIRRQEPLCPPDRPGHVRATALPDGIDLFDAAYFDMSPAEAAATDPQHRLLLDCALEAMERGGQDARRLRGPAGVFVGTGMPAYGLSRMMARGDVLGDAQGDPWRGDFAGAFQAMIGSDKDYAASRIAYKLGLTGPAMAVQTACSSSLVAVHMACQALKRGEVALALAGGASLPLPEADGYPYQEGGITSPDGRCRAFDAGANGTVPAGGAGVVVLKRLSDALADRDPILAVIRGSAVNNDGAAKVGFTAPGVDGQAAVIAAAQQAAGVSPAAIGYVETHGTGTRLGDLVEIGALTQAFHRGPEAEWPQPGACVLGALKTGVGHMDAAAGVAGLIKAALAVRHGVIPPTLHFTAADPALRLDGGPFRVSAQREDWSAAGPRLAGVSSFGIGGTNAHVVVGEAPPLPSPLPSTRPVQLLTLSARTPAALESLSSRLADHLDAAEGEEILADAAYTLQSGRRTHAHRRIVVADSRAAAAAALRRPAAGPDRTSEAGTSAPGVAFLFPGQGTQFPGMAGGIGPGAPVFAAVIERCLAALDHRTAETLRNLILQPGSRQEGDEEGSALRRTDLAQPALVATGIALAEQWMAWGVRPDLLAGHSVGELAAAAVAGILTPEDAIRLAQIRGQLMQAMPPGAMLAVELDPDQLEPLLPDGVSIAAFNGPGSTVAAGPVRGIDLLRDRLARDGVPNHGLYTSHAFHSAMMEPAADAFARAVQGVPRGTARYPLLSSLTGAPVAGDAMADPAYWRAQLLQPVRFGDVARHLVRGPRRCLVETGPGRTLISLVRSHPDCPPGLSGVSSLPGPLENASPLKHLTGAAGRLWLAGVELDWDAFHAPERPRKVALPTHPLDRRRHWLEAGTGAAGVPARSPAVSPLESPMGDAALHRPRWDRVGPPRLPDGLSGQRWAIRGEGAVADALADAARAAGVVLADPAEPLDRVVVVAGSSGAGDAGLVLDTVRALAGRGGALPALSVLTLGAEDVLGDEPLDGILPLRGIALVCGQEVPGLSVTTLDLPAEAPLLGPDGNGMLLACAAGMGGRGAVALRHGQFWRQDWTLWEGPAGTAPVWPRPPVVLITGGFGRVGRAIAGHAASAWGARLILAGRSGAAGREDVLAGLAARTEVLAVAADLADPAEARRLAGAALERFGTVDLVIHAAGLAPEAVHVPLAGVDEDALARIAAPKLDGLSALTAAFDTLGHAPGRWILCSSVAGILGGLGLSAYAAVCLGLDAVALRQNRRGGARWTSIAWDGWLTEAAEGMSDREQDRASGLSAAAAGRLLDAVVAGELEGRVAAAASPLGPRIAAWVDAVPPEQAPPAGPAVEGGALEQAIAAIWSDLLGVPAIGPDDDFFAVGGHSLAAVRMLARLRGLAGVPLSLEAILGARTPAGIARHIETLRWTLNGPATPGSGDDDEEEGEL